MIVNDKTWFLAFRLLLWDIGPKTLFVAAFYAKMSSVDSFILYHYLDLKNDIQGNGTEIQWNNR
jgi:hypothetical protein